MPTDEAYHAVLAELSKLADAWRIHREVMNRAINHLNHEVVDFGKRLDKDDVQRAVRQRELDQQLMAIRRWQWIRIGAEAGMVVILVILWVLR